MMHELKQSPQAAVPGAASREKTEIPETATTTKAEKRITAPLKHASRFLLLICFMLVMMFYGVGCIVIYQVKFKTIGTNRTDYVLAGESLELSCHYLMKDDIEDIKSIVWSKDNKNFLRWTKSLGQLEVLDTTFRGRISQDSSRDRLILRNVTIEMYGKYRCAIRTDLGVEVQERDLVVITHSPCRMNDWRIASDQMTCQEAFEFECKHMFPRPVPSCGLFDTRSGLMKLIRAVQVSIDEEPIVNSNPARQTYRVSYSESYNLVKPNGDVNPDYADLLAYAENLVFKCDIEVRDTSWKLSIEHKMFNFYDGCSEDPLEAIRRMKMRVNQYAHRELTKANHVSFSHEFRHLEDSEMVTSHMKYELFLPTILQKLRFEWQNGGGPGELVPVHSIQAFDVPQAAADSNKTRKQRPKSYNPDLSCWQKPRIGSIAKLSCVPPPPHPIDSHASRTPVKLLGSNLLECRTNGWVPIRESNTTVTNEMLDTKAYKAFVRRRPLRPARTPEAPSTSPRAEVQTISPDIDLNSAPQDGADDDSTVSAYGPFTFSPDKETVTTPQPFARLTAGDKIYLAKEPIKPKRAPDLTPYEIAKLLPTCASVTNKRRPHHPKAGDPRLYAHPDGVYSLESTVNGHRHFKTHANQRDGRPDDGTGQKWFSFSASSGSPSSSLMSGHHQQLHFIGQPHTGSLFISLLVSFALIASLRQELLAGRANVAV